MINKNSINATKQVALILFCFNSRDINLQTIYFTNLFTNGILFSGRSFFTK